MGFKDIMRGFIELNICVDMFGEITITNPLAETDSVIVKFFDKYVEKVLDTIKTEISHELGKVLEPYLRLKRSEIISQYKEINTRFKGTIEWEVEINKEENRYTLIKMKYNKVKEENQDSDLEDVIEDVVNNFEFLDSAKIIDGI